MGSDQQKQFFSDDDAVAKSKSSRNLSTEGAGNFPPTKTAVGAADGGGPNYRPGEKLDCLILGVRDGGYDVLIVKDGVNAFLRSNEQRTVGTNCVVEFLRWQDKSTS